uniref:3-methyl-2-oxobutanoate hydroxymethyltransferase n=1 Tax=Lotharella globosa TaxID=91324 RepID=A0A6V3JD08_9EUKA
MSAMELIAKRRRGERITMVTAYDYPSALHCDLAGIDIVLVGDSCGMVELGYDTTQPVTIDEMMHHARAVVRGAKHPLVVGDLPFGSYEVNPEQAQQTAYRFVKEAGVDCVKMEGGRKMAPFAQKVVNGGVAVMGHVGLTPQAISVLGGFRAQGRTAIKARELVDDALALEDAGCFAVVVECVPPQVGQAITQALEIPTIGIGSGPGTTGQVLVYHDMLGMTVHPHYKAFTPKFCKKFVDLGETIRQGLEGFKKEVESGTFPSLDSHSPYKMSKKEFAMFEEMMKEDEEERQKKHVINAEKMKNSDEYDVLNLYGGPGDKQ